MKKGMLFLAIAATFVGLVSCNKDVPEENRQVMFNVADDGFKVVDFDTKAAVYALSDIQTNGFNASATSGAGEAEAWTNVAFGRVGSTGNYKAGGTGKWWPTPNPNYHFYASNIALVYNASGNYVNTSNPNASGGVDVVCAYLATPSYTPSTGTQNTLNFQHVYARLGNVIVAAADGYTITNVTVTITPNVSGRYNIKTGFGHNDNTGWSNVTAGSSTTVFNKTTIGTSQTQANDLYLVPGNYSLNITWTATKGDFTKTYNATTDPVIFFEKGKVTSLTAKTYRNGEEIPGLVGDATEIMFSVSVEDWGAADKNMVFPI